MSSEKNTTAQWLLPALELILLLGLVPLLVLTKTGHSLRHIILLTGLLYVAWRLRKRIVWRFLFGVPPDGWWRGPLLRGFLFSLLALIFVMTVEPENLFLLPRERTGLWLLILVLYPILSALPQELIYRVYLFEVPDVLWKFPVIPVLVSAIFFGWLHIIFAGWLAVISTFVAGLVLAWSYKRSRLQPGAIWVLLLEHSLYGLTVFTIGLGKHFFIPSLYFV